MKTISKRHLLSAAAALATGLSTLGASPALAQPAYPAQDVNLVIQWGAGGGTDISLRGYTAYAEEALGRKLVITNRPGGSGAVGASQVLLQPADGYTLLGGAEPQALFRVLGLADFDYDKFTPINIAAIGDTILVVVNKDRPWKTFKELIADAQANPNKFKQYIAGAGTTPYMVNAMVNTQTKFPVINVPFDGDGPAVAALQGGHIDMAFMASGPAIEHVRAGRLRAIAVLSTKPFQGIAPMTDTLPGLQRFLPWGPWYGVFIRKEAPEPVKARLIEAFRKAGNTPAYRQMMENRGTTVLNIGGAEAEAFIRKWQSTTAWLLQDTGAAKKSPAELGIPRP
jgi:tripartite-type tricarboxylate transporter receptor subunit TctC